MLERVSGKLNRFRVTQKCTNYSKVCDEGVRTEMEDPGVGEVI